MANASTERSGMMAWVSAIRMSMAHDPGRQILEDQIQSGFLFLEDYLDNILSGPRHDPLIELLKTPGRKRDAQKKTKAATAASKPKAIVNIDSDDDEGFNKENEAPPSAPINSFHKALLQAKSAGSNSTERASPSRGLQLRDGGNHSEKPPSTKKKHASKTKAIVGKDRLAAEPATKEPENLVKQEEEEEEVERPVTPSRIHKSTIEDHDMVPPHPIASTSQILELTIPVYNHHDHLSIIAEADETVDRSKSRTSNERVQSLPFESHAEAPLTSATTVHAKPANKLPYNIDRMTVEDLDDFTQTTNFTSTQSFHTISLETPKTEARPLSEDNWSSNKKSDFIPPTDHLEKGTASSIAGDTQPQDNAQPQPGHATTFVPLHDEPEPKLHERRSNDDLFSKSGAAHFPTIGAPSPLRRSIRVPKESFQPMANSALPNKSNKTRSSWLVKTREAKAMEENAKLAKTISAQTALATHAAVGLKRKSGEMLGVDIPESDTGRTQKLTKVAEVSPILSMLKDQNKFPFVLPQGTDKQMQSPDAQEPETNDTVAQNGDGSDRIIDKLKKTVAGFSQRTGKSMGKSLGGAAADALAAKLAAEAKIAERHAAERGTVPNSTVASAHPEREPTAMVDAEHLSLASLQPPTHAGQPADSTGPIETDRRLSVSDLVSKYDPKKNDMRERVFQPPTKDGPPTKSTSTADTASSTTPSHSPLTKRPPVFTVPEKSKAPVNQVFFPPPSLPAFFRREDGSAEHSHFPQPISTQSSQSTYPDTIFDHERPPWAPSTQDTEITDREGSQSQGLQASSKNYSTEPEPETDMDADESWHLDDKYAEAWSPVAMKDDSMTWSTAPTRSTRAGDTDRLEATAPQTEDLARIPQEAIPRPVAEPSAPEARSSLEEEDMDVEEGRDLGAIRLVTPAKPSFFSANKENQATSHGGFFSSASKIVSSVLGGSKKGKEPVKSIQLAAAAAKKQQDEADKKANRLKEMEMRRQQALQKKADEERVREEKKIKEEEERWRRDKEKEDTTEKRALRQPGKKLAQIEEELAKKRKIAETEKKADPKKSHSKEKQDPTKVQKPFPIPQSSLQASNGPSKGLKQAALTFSQTVTSKATIQVFESADGPTKAKAKDKDVDIEDRKPTQLMHAQMQAHAQAEIEHSKKIEPSVPVVPSEAIELPDINSEYSDSDDEERPRAFAPPSWAQSPALREALRSQSTVDPDDIFGAIKPLRMEELFKTRTSRFRARTSSANWAGPDELTAAEERDYARRMGYTK